MPNLASGTSTSGYQDLLNGVVTNSTYINIQFTPTSASLPKRVGYLYLYQYLTTNANDRRIVLRAPLYKPACLYAVPVPRLNTSFAFYAQAYWDVPGLAWTVSMN